MKPNIGFLLGKLAAVIVLFLRQNVTSPAEVLQSESQLCPKVRFCRRQNLVRRAHSSFIQFVVSVLFRSVVTTFSRRFNCKLSAKSLYLARQTLCFRVAYPPWFHLHLKPETFNNIGLICDISHRQNVIQPQPQGYNILISTFNFSYNIIFSTQKLHARVNERSISFHFFYVQFLVTHSIIFGLKLTRLNFQTYVTDSAITDV